MPKIEFKKRLLGILRREKSVDISALMAWGSPESSKIWLWLTNGRRRCLSELFQVNVKMIFYMGKSKRHTSKSILRIPPVHGSV